MDERWCLQCGKQLERHVDETPSRWRRRRYCSLLCVRRRATNSYRRKSRAPLPEGFWDPLDTVDDDLVG